MADLNDADIFQEIGNCVAALNRIGMEVLVVDTTHPDLQIPAAYTIIPGAHFRERAMGGNAALFAAKLAADLLYGGPLDAKLAAMQELAPEVYALPFYRGRHLYEQGRADAALACFQEALSLSPNAEDLPYLFSYTGCCLRDLGRYDEAIDLLRQGLDQDEERPDIHNAMGVCCYKTGRFAEAAGCFQRAVELNPASAIDYANLALNQERLGEIDRAMVNYEIALSQDPDIGFAAARLTALLADQGRERRDA